jgi:hypothetical protein
VTATHIEVFTKHGEWLVKVDWDVYLGPYSYEAAIVTATALADVFWQLGRPASVIVESRNGERRTVWDHPAERHAAYA